MTIKLTLKDIQNALECEIDSKYEKSFKISTDTRTIEKGDMYLPLKGENFDGENFIQRAIEKGAIGSFYTKKNYDNGIFIKTENTLESYLKLANYIINKLKPIVIGVTGSSGKTTTKEMIYSVVSEKYNTQKTFSNHNNEIGFSQTVMNMDYNTEVLIIEMGMRGPGEIELISKYAQPDIAIITNSGSAHIGRLGSLDNIAKAKCEITKFLKDTLIANDNKRIKKFADFYGNKIFYSINDVKILEKRERFTRFIYKDREYEINVDGDYNIENSLAAIETGYKLNISYEQIKSGLKKYKPIEKRWEIQNVAGYNIINDSYNANPDSMKAAVKAFLELHAKSLIILGNMGELGENEIELHKDVGKFILNSDKTAESTFITIGNLAKYIGNEIIKSGAKVMNFDNNIETSRYILDNINIGTTIFLKASRSMKFEEIIDKLKESESTL